MPSVYALGIAGEHLDDVIVQAIVELLLERPWKLSIFYFARMKLESVVVHFGVCGFVADFNFHALSGGTSFEIKKGMFVAPELVPDFIRE
jgi:hypothetical protein